jgi:hypothetical protein
MARHWSLAGRHWPLAGRHWPLAGRHWPRAGRRWVLVLVGIAVGAGLVAAGRFTSDAGAARSDGYRAGRAAGYAAGVDDGRAAGVREGRAFQAPLSLPPGSQDAARASFQAGYAAGANDVFGGYDGGWDTEAPYVVVLTPGGPGITYRIRSRTPMRPGVSYHLCPGSRSTLCQD